MRSTFGVQTSHYANTQIEARQDRTISLVGTRWDNSRLLAITKALSPVIGGFRRPPNYLLTRGRRRSPFAVHRSPFIVWRSAAQGAVRTSVTLLGQDIGNTHRFPLELESLVRGATAETLELWREEFHREHRMRDWECVVRRSLSRLGPALQRGKTSLSQRSLRCTYSLPSN